MNNFLQDISDQEGFLIPLSIASKLHVPIGEISRLTGLDAASFDSPSHIHTESTQKRLWELLNIINKIIPWCKNIEDANVWYQNEPLSSFGKLTAMELVKQGKAKAVIQYLERIDKGGFS